MYPVLHSVNHLVNYFPMRLQNAPLVHVLAQVVFSPLLRFEERVAAFREAVHEAGFPWVQQSFLHEVTVAAELGSAPVPSVVVKPRWDYVSADRRTGVTLTDSSVALQTTDYSSRAPFFAQLYRVLNACAATMGPEYVERIGLRFTDVVRVQRGERFSQYIHTGLLGFPWRDTPGLEARGVGLRTESVAETSVGHFLVRSVVLPPTQVVPPDLNPTPLVFAPIQKEVAEQPALSLDFDHFVHYNQPPHVGDPVRFDTDRVLDVVRRLHAGHREAFEAAGTEYAIKQWGPWV
jgi:uncharacterized protein (TIGR04255 family)